MSVLVYDLKQSLIDSENTDWSFLVANSEQSDVCHSQLTMTIKYNLRVCIIYITYCWYYERGTSLDWMLDRNFV